MRGLTSGNDYTLWLVMRDAIETYEGFLSFKHCTDAERTLTTMKLAACREEHDRLQSRLGLCPATE